MSFKHNFTQNDWDNLTQTTKDDINFALSQELDSIGNFVFNKSEKSVNALIQMAQSLTNPKTIGAIQTKQEWATTARNGKVMESIKPYSNAGYSSLAVTLPWWDASKLLIPVKRNYSEQNCSLPLSASRYKKFVEKIQPTFGLKVVENSSYSSPTTYGIEKVKEAAFKKADAIVLNCNNAVTTDYDRFAMILNCLAKQAVENEVKSFNNPSYIALNDKDKENFKIATEKLATLGLARATILDDNNPAPAKALDDALKFDFFHTLTLLDGKRNDIVKSISTLTETVVESICNKLGYTKEAIVGNLKNLGYKYAQEPKSVFEAIFMAGNLEAIATEVQENETTKVAKQKALDCVAKAAKAAKSASPSLTKKIIAYKGTLDAAIIDKKDYDKFFESDSQDVITFVLGEKLEKAKQTGRGQKKYQTAVEKSPEIAQEFSVRVKAMLGKTFELAKSKSEKGELKTTSVPKLFKEANNEENSNKTPHTIARETFKETVNDVVKKANDEKKAERKAKKQTAQSEEMGN